MIQSFYANLEEQYTAADGLHVAIEDYLKKKETEEADESLRKI